MALFNSPAHQRVVVSLLKNNMQVNETDIINFLTRKSWSRLQSFYAVCFTRQNCSLQTADWRTTGDVPLSRGMHQYHNTLTRSASSSGRVRLKKESRELLGDFDYEGKVR